MEPVASMSEGDWSSFSGMYFTEEADFMAQLLGNCSLPNDLPVGSTNFGVSSGFWNGHESNMSVGGARDQVSHVYSSNDTMYSTGGSCFHFPPPTLSHESYYPCQSRPILMRNDSSITTEHGVQMDNNNPIEADDFLNQDVSNDSDENMAGGVLDGKGLQLGRIDYEQYPEDKIESPSESSKKRARLHAPAGHVPKNKRSAKLQMNLKTGEMDRKNKAVLQRQNSMISCCSEDECIDVPKSRASRGSATDPQSLYARKRRERINERLKILQSLIPNGTKVDISTMLEEAVEYVKFLQLQIKLLSSDDLWMYAPIAYNGMDIGLDLRIGIPK